MSQVLRKWPHTLKTFWVTSNTPRGISTRRGNGTHAVSEHIELFQIPWGVGNALSGLGGVALAGSNTGEAQRLLKDATSALRQSGPWFLTPVLCFRAVLALHAGEVDEVMALMHESLTYIRTLQDKFAFVYRSCRWRWRPC